MQALFAVLIFAFSTLALSPLVVAQPTGEYPRAEERAKMLAELERPPQVLQIDFNSKVGSREQAFLEIFAREYWPIATKLEALSLRASILYVAIDRALYNDEAENKAWEATQVAAEKEADAINASEQKQEIVRRLARAAEGLTGDLPDLARQNAENQERFVFGEADLPLKNRLTEVEAAIQSIANNSPVARHLDHYSRRSIEIDRAFRRGELSFAQATGQIEAMAKKNYAAHGQYIATAARALLDEAAILRTELARRKGFKNWAEYQLSANARYFAPDLQSIASRTAFLDSLLTSTKEAHRAFLQQRIREIPGVPQAIRRDVAKIRRSQLSLLNLPTESIVAEYFPVGNVEAVWKEAMKASGFSPSVVDGYSLDSYPRRGKQTHAYMANVKSHQPTQFRIDARTMKVAVPRAVPGRWTPALIYVVQNFRADGLDSYVTAFHEGGHYLDYKHRRDALGFGQASSYSETHSTTMEHFFADPQFLLAVGRAKDGTAIPEVKVREYLANEAGNRLGSLRGQSVNALFDLQLWDHAYEPGGESFVDRSLRLQAELYERYMFSRQGVFLDGIDARYGRYSTDHFYGGQVRYIGYIFADVAAKLSYQRLLDVLEKTTGRRTLLNQPSLAKLLIDGYYKDGFALPFPLATERFTGQPFDPKAMAAAVNRSVEGWISSRPAAPSGGIRLASCQGLFH